MATQHVGDEYCLELAERKAKSVSVEDLKAVINSRIAYCPTKEGREVLASLLSHILMQTKNYKGFNYIEWSESGVDRWRADGSPEDKTPYLGDQSRVFFY